MSEVKCNRNGHSRSCTLREGPCDDASSSASVRAEGELRIKRAIDALKDESLAHGPARFAALSLLSPEPITPEDVAWAEREVAALQGAEGEPERQEMEPREEPS